MLKELKEQILRKEITLSEALPRVLPELRGRVSDEKLLWLSRELQGYDDALDFYRGTSHGLPPYRIVKGTLYRVGQDGSITPMTHPYAQRSDFFLSAPISWLEQEAKVPGDESLIELTEFSAFKIIGDHGVVCACAKNDVRRLVSAFQVRLLRLFDELIRGPVPRS